MSFNDFSLVWTDYVNREVEPFLNATSDYLGDVGISIDKERLDTFEKKSLDELFAISKLVPLMMELKRGYEENLDKIQRIRIEQNRLDEDYGII